MRSRNHLNGILAIEHGALRTSNTKIVRLRCSSAGRTPLRATFRGWTLGELTIEVIDSPSPGLLQRSLRAPARIHLRPASRERRVARHARAVTSKNRVEGGKLARSLGLRPRGAPSSSGQPTGGRSPGARSCRAAAVRWRPCSATSHGHGATPSSATRSGRRPRTTQR